ncbi:IclR family transcriptional regulator [Halobacterium noricense]|uniref:IclR family transcriptional regulator n=1 Tax=Halobacterium noricense TaxID=223182 RepID=UPI001E53677C|nr:IclR family transcriptional regulator [Halobacterium noricense]UHH23953.1 IclR family transcriptional regulator [Halobacterium noricense]
MGNDTPPIKSVQRAFRVFHALWELQSAGPSELASYLDLSKSTAHVYLRSLEETGYVVNHNGEYELSYQFLTVGSQLKYRNRLFQVSEAEMNQLARDTGELVTLVIEQAGESVLIHQEHGDQALELGMYPGLTIPLHSHASGKLFLTHMSEERREEVFDRHGLEPVTEATITDRNTLLAELEQIRDAGYAYDWDQQVRGMGVIAQPIVVEDELEGVLSVACPTGRLQEEKYRDELRQKLQGAVDTISIKFQYGN